MFNDETEDEFLTKKSDDDFDEDALDEDEPAPLFMGLDDEDGIFKDAGFGLEDDNY